MFFALFRNRSYPIKWLSVVTDEAEFMKAAFAIEQENIKVSIDAAVAILCGY